MLSGAVEEAVGASQATKRHTGWPRKEQDGPYPQNSKSYAGGNAGGRVYGSGQPFLADRDAFLGGSGRDDQKPRKIPD